MAKLGRDYRSQKSELDPSTGVRERLKKLDRRSTQFSGQLFRDLAFNGDENMSRKYELIIFSALHEFKSISKQIELEYLSMIDQVIFACDDKLNVLYNNYHERFYDNIMRKVEDHVDMK